MTQEQNNVEEINFSFTKFFDHPDIVRLLNRGRLQIEADRRKGSREIQNINYQQAQWNHTQE